jgi:hypothetical protein
MSVVARFREQTLKFRDCAAFTAAQPRATWHDVMRTHSVTIVFAMFVAASGAFGTARITPDVRYPILVMLTVLGIAIDLGVTAVLKRWIRFKLPSIGGAFRTLMVLACTIFLCWTVARVFEGARGTPPLSRFVLPVLVFAGFAAAAGRAGTLLLSPLKAREGSRPGFVERLPRSIQSAEIIAVEGEDHYVRVHTSLGRHLLLMRFGDALDELKMLEGLQTHRSWWVAKSAVTAVKRGNGRATLKLANGLEAPVSRRYTQRLRESGWY